MRIPYSFIFRSGGVGEDGEIAACGMNNSFMRLLFSLLDYPTTFYDADLRVVLSDGEKQLIESGIAALTKLFIDGGCNVLTLDRSFASDFTVVPNATNALLFSTGTINEDFMSYNAGNGEFTVLVGGIYTIIARTIVRFSSMPNEDFSLNCLIMQNGITRAVDENFRLAGRVASASCPGIFSAQAGDILSIRFWHTASQNVNLQHTITTLKAIYHG